jgi:NAD(P)H-dependent FMN reductase
MPNLMIIVGSTRPGRAGLPIARWFEAQAREHGAFDIDFADLAEIDLPFLDEPKHPRLHEYEHEHTKRWSARVEAADAFVLVHPEYNHSYTAPVKNAIDYLNREWHDKPVGFVSYGGVSAGVRAMTALKPVVTAVRMLPVVDAVNIPFFQQFFSDGEFHANDVMTDAAAAMLDELERAERMLRALRDERGAVSSS